jgi:uncharacterized protein (DUF302 family)
MVRLFFTFFFSVLVVSGAQASADNLIVKSSAFSVSETVTRLVAAVEGAGANVFAVVDHAKGAKSVGEDMAPATVVIFGNPALGTAPLLVNPVIGLDLPLKVLIWDEDGSTKITYLDPQALKSRYDIEGADNTFVKMAGALKNLTDKAAGP